MRSAADDMMPKVCRLPTFFGLFCFSGGGFFNGTNWFEVIMASTSDRNGRPILGSALPHTQTGNLDQWYL